MRTTWGRTLVWPVELLNCKVVNYVTSRGGFDMPHLLWNFRWPGAVAMQPQFLQKLPGARFGQRLTWMSSVQKKIVQIWFFIQFGSEKCLWGRLTGEKREAELWSASGKVKTVLRGWQGAYLRGVSSIQITQDPWLSANRGSHRGVQGNHKAQDHCTTIKGFAVKTLVVTPKTRMLTHKSALHECSLGRESETSKDVKGDNVRLISWFLMQIFSLLFRKNFLHTLKTCKINWELSIEIMQDVQTCSNTSR